MAFSADALNDAAEAIAAGVTKVGLHTGDPGANGANNEVNGNAYARADTVGNDWAVAAGAASNDAVVQFPTPTGSWGTTEWFSCWIGGVFRFSAQLTTARAIATGTDVEFAVGELRTTVPSS